MNAFEGMLQQDEKHYRALNALTKPLQRFGIDIFAYCRMTPDGNYINTCNSPERSRFLLGGDLYKGMNFLCHPDGVPEGGVFMEQDPDYQQVMSACPSNLALFHPFCILRRDDLGNAHYYMFVSSKEDPTLPQFFVNRFGLLNSYIDYFNSESTGIRESLTAHGVSIPDLIGTKRFECGTYQLGQECNPEKACDFMKDLGVDSFTLNAAKKLSRREKEVMAYLLAGKVTSEIASTMGLSRRTVEHYFENAKNKLGVDSRRDLFQLAQLFQLVGLL